MEHLIARVQAAHQSRPELSMTVDLTSAADPAVPLLPGQQLDLTLTINPVGNGYRYYAYLMEEQLTGVASVTAHRGFGHMEKAKKYGTYTPANSPRTLTFSVRVNDAVPGDGVLMPTVSAGVIAAEGQKLSGCPPIVQRGYRVVSAYAPPKLLVVAPGTNGMLPGLAHELGPDARLVGVSPPRRGMVGIGPDGTVTYYPDQGFVGYDRLFYTVENGSRGIARGEITVVVGQPYEMPGVLAAPTGQLWPGAMAQPGTMAR
ncbi:Ig-like domain-containing protein [Kitasatospora sp. HPMI-4]|uniref:Ig-like domain-containing protein n=1 Tax=Kitasatospora sp. HPMI-4 TaxID=3448443 RepID=UPI003F1DBBB6